MVRPESGCPRIESRDRRREAQADTVNRTAIWEGHNTGNKVLLRIELPWHDAPMREDRGVVTSQDRALFAIEFKRHFLKLVCSRDFLK